MVDKKGKQREKSAAVIMSRYFSSEVIFLVPSNAYRQKTADYIINDTVWELKSFITKSPKTLKKRFKEGLYQSKNIIVDLRESKVHEHTALTLLKRLAMNHRDVRLVLCILKSKEVIVIK